jgi:hypothetical protein
MPGLINAHKYPIRKNAKFIRLRHTEQSQGSLFLSDLDTPENKASNAKIPVYVPYGETVDVLLTDRVLTSYQQGSIRGFLDDGLLEAFIVQNIEVKEGIEQFVPSYQVQIDDDLLTVDSSGGDVLVNLPDVLSEPFPEERTPQGTRITIKKITDDDNSIIISPAPGNAIEGDIAAFILEAPKGVLTLQADELGNWWVLSVASTSTSTPLNNTSSRMTFTQERPVPSSVGILYLRLGDVVTLSAPWVVTTDMIVVAGSISVDRPDPSPYAVEFYVNDVFKDQFILPANQTKTLQPLNISLLENDEVAVRLYRTTGGDQSSFCNTIVNLQLTDT